MSETDLTSPRPDLPEDQWPPADLPLTIPGILDRAAERFADDEALVDGDVRLTFAELRGRVDDAARALLAAGIERGDRIGFWAPNIWEWVVASQAVHRIGAAVIPVNTRFKGAEAAYVLAKSGARLLFSVTDFLDTDYVAMLRDSGEPVPAIETVVVLRGAVADDTLSWDDFLATGADVDQAAVEARAAEVEPDDLSDILFTSGTTGKPKGAMLRHGASIRAYHAWGSVVGLRHGDRYLIINPFFHAFGLKAGILASVIHGATIVPHAVFDVPSVIQRVAEEKISMLPGAPTIYQSMLDHPDVGAYDLSTLRLAVTGAAPVPVEMIRRMRAELTFKTIVTGYGLTETHGIATMCRHTDAPETISGTSGRPIPGLELRVVDDDGKDVAVGEPGAVLLRGYNLMTAYFDDPAETAATIDADGWLHTGDIGVLDEAGYLKITDRTKDMFIVGGFNAYPAEIEDLMLRHPGIAQVAVIGVPDHRLGEVAMAYVVPRHDTTVDPHEVKAWCRAEMANYKAPRHVQVVEALPLNASGKVLKYELRARAEADLAGPSNEDT